MKKPLNLFTRFMMPLFLTVSFLSVAAGCKKSRLPSTPPSPLPIRVSFAGVGAHGIFDPSFAQDPATPRTWMIYSAVDPSGLWPTQNYDVVSTRLAYSDDRGATWTESGSVVNSCLDVDLAPILTAPLNAGTWQNEVPTLLFDPGAPASQRWKLLWHHYLVLNNLRQINNHAWVGLKMAASPDLLAAAPEIKLFSSYNYDPLNDTQGGITKSPLGGAPNIALDLAFAPLNGGMFSEPGLMATGSAIYLSLLCVNPPNQHRVVILKCGSPCDPTSSGSWAYLGTALSDANGAGLGFDQGFSAPNLVHSGSNDYLVVTPVSSAPFDGFYNGCYVYRFNDLETASLSTIAPVQTVLGTPGTFRGAGTYLPTANLAGLTYSQLETSAPDRFRIMKSGVNF